jgi:hypothetical protein
MSDIEQGLIKEEDMPNSIDAESLPTAIIINTAEPLSMQTVMPLQLNLSGTISSAALNLGSGSRYRSKNDCCCDIANCGQREMVGLLIVICFSGFIIFVCNYMTVPPGH